MDKGGEIVPELGDILNEIADRLQHGKVQKGDADILRRIASQASGEHSQFILKVHRSKAHAPSKGAEGVDRRYRATEALINHRKANGGTWHEAYIALDGFEGLGSEALKKARLEMKHLFEATGENRKMLLFFMRLKARGLVNIS